MRLFRRPAPLLLDGGSATALASRGCRLHPTLWSAGVLLEAPDAVRKMHRSFLEAGAEVISTVGYQGSHAALARAGIVGREAQRFLRLAVEVAVAERDDFVKERRIDSDGPPCVAASIGPYGAYLLGGLEYDGRYGLGVSELGDFHRPHFKALAAGPADVIALETIPSLSETQALCELVGDTPGVRAWISFVCRDGERLCDGTPVEKAVGTCNGIDGLVAVGVNCVPPQTVAELVARVASATDLPVIAYPNAGPGYGADAYRSTGGAPKTADAGHVSEGTGFGDLVPGWIAAGVRAVGGCCGVDVPELKAIARAMGRSRPPRTA